MNYTTVAVETHTQPVPPAPNGSNPRAGQPEYVTTVTQRGTWPEDGSIYAGRSYDRIKTYLSPEPPVGSHYGQLIGMHDFPTT